MDAAHIRNFCIIAHIDHGKTTLSDRLLHRTGTISTREMEDQLLDSMDLEKERGITIKAHPVTMLYKAKSGETYELNLIDTPGHVDFSYEVSRSLSACEGALLVVDAAQGVEAQTVANVHLAMNHSLEIIPVINKIDLPHANVAQARQQLEDILAIPGDTAIPCSAKEGIGIDEILEAIVERIPPPKPTLGGCGAPPQGGGSSALAAASGNTATMSQPVVAAAPLPPRPFVGFDPNAPVGFLRGGNLPHWRQPGATYFVTWRTMDSMPKERVEAWFAERKEWLRWHPEPWKAHTEEEYYRLFPDRWEKWLDESHGECLLARTDLREIVEDVLCCGDVSVAAPSQSGRGAEAPIPPSATRASPPPSRKPKYRLTDFIVMPNHVHVLLTPLGENTLSEALQEWKSISAHRINKALGRYGEFWQKESFDHIVRSPEQLEKFKSYIRHNPQWLPEKLRGAVAFSLRGGGGEASPSPSATGASRLRDSLQALAFDSYFDTYKGVVTHVRVFNGEVRAGMQIKLLHSGKTHEVKEVGSFNPKPFVREKLETGETGYITANIKSPQEVKMGDTITDARRPAEALPGFKEIHPMVFSGIYPINTADYEHLKVSMAKLQLNDSAFVYQAETSVALGFGFRCGFLGLLHLEIAQERLRREYNMDIIATYPSVIYRITMTDGAVKEIDNPVFLPEPNHVRKIEEPVVKAFIICPNENIGDMMALISEKRGTLDHTETLDARRVMMTTMLPLNEILIDFHDRIKSMTRGYGSMDYEHTGYAESDMIKLDMLVNGEVMDAFSSIVHRSKAEGRGRALAEKLKEVIPRQQYQVKIQAAIGGKIIASEHVSALRKDVTAKCYGGDITRKRKLLEKQKEGKKRMKSIGSVNIPQEAFIEVLKA